YYTTENPTKGMVMKLEELPTDVAEILGKRLSDQAICRLLAVSKFFGNTEPGAYRAEWLRRRAIAGIRQYNVIPELLIERCLSWQDPTVLERFLQLLRVIHPQLTFLQGLPQAEWMVYALLEQPEKVNVAMLDVGPHPEYQPYHFYSLIG
ncbi:MAG: hypothetical protein M3R00_05980, partial [Pseudomonadota bacterium]|nr:hypothetical protein [Pseudomonadota bacterium]